MSQPSVVHHSRGGGFKFCVFCPSCLYQIWKKVLQSSSLYHEVSCSNPVFYWNLLPASYLIQILLSWLASFHIRFGFLLLLYQCCLNDSSFTSALCYPWPCPKHIYNISREILFRDFSKTDASYPKHFVKLLTFYMAYITECTYIFSPCNYKCWCSPAPMLALYMPIYLICKRANLKTVFWLCIFLQLVQMKTNFSHCVCYIL